MSILSTLTIIGNQPNLHTLDNEASSSLRQGFLNNNIKYHMLPPHLRRRNEAKRSIQTFKAHCITCLCVANPGYPEKYWDRFLPQATFTLNLLRNCRFDPKL